MKLFTSILAVLGLALALPACDYKPESKANLLADSGFKQLSLNSPAKLAAFKTLPAHRLSKTNFKGKSVWVYPDRNVCGCLYIGSQASYDAYIKKATQQMKASYDAYIKKATQQMIDTRVNQMYDNNDTDPYNPTATMAGIEWGDAWDTADMYGLYLN